MADTASMALGELLRKAQMRDDVDCLREGIRVLAQALMEVEVTQHVAAGRYERTPERTGERNGSRERRWDTRVGSIELRVPRVRDGSYFPSLLEPRRRAERALVAVVQEAYVHGISTRRVDELAQALGLNGISTSQVSLVCQELDSEVERFRNRPLGEAAYPYLWLDATSVKARASGRICGQAVVIAIGLNAATGQREVLGMDVGPSEDAALHSGWGFCAVWWHADSPASSSS
jgi:putative transposase